MYMHMENCSVILLFASQIYGAAVADNLDKNRGVLNRRYFRQVRTLSVFTVYVLLLIPEYVRYMYSGPHFVMFSAQRQ